jgi:uncharacterized protein
MKHAPQNPADGESMKLRLDRIGDEGYELDAPVAVAWLDQALGKGSPFKADGDGRLVVRLDKVEEVVHVRGRARLKLKSHCSRCLGDVSLALDAPIEVALFPRGSEPEAGPDGEVASEDMGVASYDHEEIDLGGIVHDEVFLELPMTPVCSDDCQGLCQQCGQNLNEKTCDCEPAADPRWSALQHIKLN